jgi:NifB/MoaA-like Fe-S oxidoreductase
VTTAGLLPGTAVQAALRGRSDLDVALIPGESLNDDGVFIDGMMLELLRASVPMEVRPSKDFVDALEEPVAA